MPAAAARAEDSLPIGLAHGVRLRRRIAAGTRISCADVDLDESDPVVRLRHSSLGSQ
jgi:predicted homoserine dehydrogenase-like protein